MRIWVQKSVSMQKRTSPLKFGDLAEKSGLNSVSNLSTKVSPCAPRERRAARDPDERQVSLRPAARLPLRQGGRGPRRDPARGGPKTLFLNGTSPKMMN